MFYKEDKTLAKASTNTKAVEFDKDKKEALDAALLQIEKNFGKGSVMKLGEKAHELANELCKYFPCDYDEAGSIGKRYRREDEIGTPFCITYDFDSLEDNCVTIRDRDTMEQVRMPISEVRAYIEEKIRF